MTLVNDAEKRARSVFAAGSGVSHDACRETAYKLARDVMALVAEIERHQRDAETWGGVMQERDDARAVIARAKDLAYSIDLWDSDGIPVDIGIDAEAGKVLELRKVLDA